MAKRQVFYSFHFDNDVMRVQQIRNIGAIEGNPPVSASYWEDVEKKGSSAIEKWIEDNMKYRSCVVVLVGEETANRKRTRKGDRFIFLNCIALRYSSLPTLSTPGEKGTQPFSLFFSLSFP